jgi:hypothetical protein
MHYFEARQVLKRLREFRRLALLSWTLTGGLEVGGRLMYEIARVAADDLPAIEPASIPDQLRKWDRSIQEMIPTVKVHAAQLDVSLDQNGYNVLKDLLVEQPQAALDAIDRCIGAADEARHRALLRLVIPTYWLVDIPALAVRWPGSS